MLPHPTETDQPSLTYIKNLVKTARAQAEPAIKNINEIYAQCLRNNELTELVLPARAAWQLIRAVIDQTEEKLEKSSPEKQNESAATLSADKIYQTLAPNCEQISTLATQVENYYEKNRAREEKLISGELTDFNEYYNKCLGIRDKAAQLVASNDYQAAAKLCLRVPQYQLARLVEGPRGHETPRCRQFTEAVARYKDMEGWMERFKSDKLPREDWLAAQLEVHEEDLAQKREDLLAENKKIVDEALAPAALQEGIRDGYWWYNQMNPSVLVLQDGVNEIANLLLTINKCQEELSKVREKSGKQRPGGCQL